jgi:hypothetical protein
MLRYFMNWRQVVLARRLLPILLCAVLLTSCRYGGPESLFDDDLGFCLALAQLKSVVGQHARALKIEIESDRIAMSIQDPADRRHVNEWRINRLRVYQFIWDRLSGPSPVALDLINPNLEENLFNLDDVDFDATTRLMKASIERAALEDPGRVTRMEIVRPTVIIPVPSSGDVRWSVRVSSGRESAVMFATVKGRIVRADVGDTNRARTANFLQRPEYLVDAVRDLRDEIGARPVLLQADLSMSNVAFLTSIPDKGSIVATADRPARATYLWNLNGLRRGIGSSNTGLDQRAPFSIDDVDWKVVPAIVAAAKEKLGMQKGRVEDIKISRPAEGVGAPPLLWEIQITDPGNDKGTFTADVTGAMKRMKLPPGRRQPIDWYDPATMVSMIDRIGREFGPGAKFFQLIFMDDKVVITATDPRQPSEPVQVLLTENGFMRFGTASMFATKSRPFTLAELLPLTPEKLTELKASTLKRLTMPPKSVSSITVARSFVDPSPRGSVTIEIRAEERPGGRGGRVNYELDGKELKAYLP